MQKVKKTLNLNRRKADLNRAQEVVRVQDQDQAVVGQKVEVVVIQTIQTVKVVQDQIPIVMMRTVMIQT